jgi:hypothetical protein
MMYAGFPNEKLRFAYQAGQYEHLSSGQMPVLAYLNCQGSKFKGSFVLVGCTPTLSLSVGVSRKKARA